MRKLWLLLLIASLAASAVLVNAAGSGAHGSTVGTNVKVWIGLKNSDDVGTSFDLKAEVTNGSNEGYGTLPGFNGGSSGFNNAHLATIPVNYSGSAGSAVSVTLFVRVSCASKHTSGTARLWWNDSQADSRVEDTGFGTLHLTGANTLSPSAGPGPKMTKDLLVKKNGCALGGDGGTWQPFGTWTNLRNVTLVFNVTVPASTDATGRSVYIEGNLDQLDPPGPPSDPNGVALTRVDATHWTITLHGQETRQLSYKYTLGDFDHIEKGPACEEITDRQLIISYGASGTQTVNDTVSNWRNVAPCGS